METAPRSPIPRACPLAFPVVPDIRVELAEHLRGHASPVLFVGSGLALRYAGAENWEGLLRHFAGMTDRPYEYYRSRANNDLPTVATGIAEKFNDIWWDRAEFAESRAEYTDSISSNESALKIEVARHLAGAATRLPTSGDLADEIELLSNAVVDVIITTNYDDILPTLFPDFRPFVGQEGLLFANPQGVGELYQIHGSIVQPESLVLTADDYERFDRRNAYLAAKLMTIFVEHPIIFLGYSLSDRNVQSILRSIAGCLTQRNIDQLRDRLIFIEWQGGVESTIGPHTFMIDDFVLPVVQLRVPDFVDVFTVLAQLRRAFPAKLLRRLKEQVYELVLTNDPHQRLVVADIDDATDDRDIDVVFGVGLHAKLSQVGLVGLTRENLINDILGKRASYPARGIVEESLPQILPTSGFVPVHKYLRSIDALDDSGKVKKSAKIDSKVEKMAEKIRAGMPASADIKRKAPSVLSDINSIRELEAAHGAKGVLNYGTCLPEKKVDPEELRTFLNENIDLREDQWLNTQYVKLVCYLDWIENGMRSTSKPAKKAGRSDATAKKPAAQRAHKAAAASKAR